MPQPKELKPGDPSPVSGATMVLDYTQHPDTLIDRHTRNAHSPDVAARYAARVREKVAEHGLLYVDPVSGYRARFKAADSDRGAARRTT